MITDYYLSEVNAALKLTPPEVTPAKANGNDVEKDSQPDTRPSYPPLELNGRRQKGHDANGIFDISMLTDFIYATNTHSAHCGVAMDITVFNNSQGAHITEIWQCPRCRHCIQLDSSKMVTTDIVEPGRKFSRKQPSINLRITKASHDHGVGLVDKTVGFLSQSLGIKISSKRNILRTHKKVKVAIKTIAAARQEENMKEHVSLTRSTEGYEGDVEWDHIGEKCSTSKGSGAFDGCGATRSYGNKHKGKQSAFVVTSGVSKKPIALVHYYRGNIERTIVELSNGLGLEVNSVELEAQAKNKRKRKKDVLRNSLEPAKLRREQQRVFNDIKMGKDAAREDRYGKRVPLTESAKSKSTSGSKSKNKKSKKVPRCSRCKQEYHSARNCLMPAPNKRRPNKVQVLDWFSEYDPIVEERASKRMKQSKEVNVLNCD